jgi:hypothetical protein
MKTRLILIATISALVFTVGYAWAQETITGCLKGPNAEGVYELVSKQQTGEIEVGGNPDLPKHVGHTVKLTGQWVKSGAEIGEKKAGPEEKNEKHFKVSSLEHIEAGCAK